MVDIRDMPLLFAAPLVRLQANDPARRDAPRQPARDRRRRRQQEEAATPTTDDGQKLDEYI